MVESETLQFENGRALQNLYANDLRLLQSLEEKLDLKVTTRDGWLRLEGERNNIEKARQLFDQLEAARQRGMQIHRHEFQYAFDVVSGRSQESGSTRRSADPWFEPANADQSEDWSAAHLCPSNSGMRYWSLALDQPVPERPIWQWQWPWKH